jgi:2-polyprenyl-3-methyl-5-hydroxy-6-metoxy-1,4-benzoquinol methylase
MVERAAAATTERAQPGRSQGACPLCGGAGRHLLSATDRNRATTAERFDYSRCTTCQTVFLVDPPADLARYYDENGYYDFDADGEPFWKGSEQRIRAARYRIELLRCHVPSGHLIEIGAGTGAFACAARDADFDVSVIEMSEQCCRYLSEQEGIRTIRSDQPVEALAELPPARAVAMWHVLEHLANPGVVLDAIAEKLEPGGVLALGVPNPRSFQFRLMGARWAHLDAPRHLSLTPAAALISRAEELGLRCVEATTNDPEGLEFNQLGWTNALLRRPSDRAASPWVGTAALAISAAAAPIERTGLRGAALTLLLRKPS